MNETKADLFDAPLPSEARATQTAQDRAAVGRRKLMVAAVEAAKPGETWWPALAPLTKAERRFVLQQLGVRP